MPECRCLPEVREKCPECDGPECTYAHGSKCEEDNLSYIPQDLRQELMAYRATRLDPDEVMLYKEAQEISESMAPARLIELAQAEKAGRLLVLPEGINKTALMARLHWLESQVYTDERETYTTGYRNGHKNGVIEALRSVLGVLDGTQQAPDGALKKMEEERNDSD